MYHQLFMPKFKNVTMVNSCAMTDHNYHYTQLGGDIIFSAANSIFTMTTGDRKCFNVTVVDDDELDRNENVYFRLRGVNTSISFYDSTQITVRDNEGQ